MAREVRSFNVVVPSGTTTTAPAVISLAVPPRTLRALTLTIPNGCAGLVGFQLASGGVQILPINQGAYISGNNRLARWDVDGYPNSGAFQAICYNTDLFNHTLLVELELDMPPGTDAAAAPPVLTNTDLSSPIPTAG